MQRHIARLLLLEQGSLLSTEIHVWLRMACPYSDSLPTGEFGRDDRQENAKAPASSLR